MRILLAATVGLPYFLLASTSPLLQAWYVRSRPAADPYPLFAVSNLASLVALIGYPLAVEPWLTNREQIDFTLNFGPIEPAYGVPGDTAQVSTDDKGLTFTATRTITEPEAAAAT